MFGVYLKVMKGFVWHQTTWTQNTYGVTGRLLEHGLERYVEVAQVAALTIVYAVGSPAIASTRQPTGTVDGPGAACLQHDDALAG